MPIIEAQYPGTCAVCGKGINVGEKIAPVGERWVHASCEEGRPPRVPVTVIDDKGVRKGVLTHDERGDLIEDAEYARGVNDTLEAQQAGPAGSEAREQAYREMEARWDREGFDG